MDALSKMGVISESDLKNAKKTAEKVAEERGVRLTKRRMTSSWQGTKERC